MKYLWSLFITLIIFSTPTIAKGDSKNFTLNCTHSTPNKFGNKSSYTIKISPSEISYTLHRKATNPYTKIYKTTLIQKTIYSSNEEFLYNYYGVKKNKHTGKAQSYIALKKGHAQYEWSLLTASFNYDNDLDYMEFAHQENLKCRKK